MSNNPPPNDLNSQNSNDLEINELREAFSLFDKNNESVITVNNLYNVMNTIEPNLNLKKSEIKEILNELDITNKECKLNFEDFLKFINKSGYNNSEQDLKKVFNYLVNNKILLLKQIYNK